MSFSVILFEALRHRNAGQKLLLFLKRPTMQDLWLPVFTQYIQTWALFLLLMRLRVVKRDRE